MTAELYAELAAALRQPQLRDFEEVLREHGSMDAFEYRYTGATGLTVGGVLSRCVGRLSFWWWERRLRRARGSGTLGGGADR